MDQVPKQHLDLNQAQILMDLAPKHHLVPKQHLVRQNVIMDQTPTDLAPKPHLALKQARILMDLDLRRPLDRNQAQTHMDLVLRVPLVHKQVTHLALKPLLVRNPALNLDLATVLAVQLQRPMLLAMWLQ